MERLNKYFEKRKDYGAIFLRLVIGWRLIAGVLAYAIQSKPISEVSGYFTELKLPVPVAGAYLSVYAQFICGILFVIGLWVRPAAIVMVINFTIAILAAHLHDSVEKSFAAWVLLGASLFFLFNGAGKISIDSTNANTSLKNY